MSMMAKARREEKEGGGREGRLGTLTLDPLLDYSVDHVLKSKADFPISGVFA